MFKKTSENVRVKPDGSMCAADPSKPMTITQPISAHVAAGPIDVTPDQADKLSADINKVIDAALERINQAEEPRDYLGGSRAGVECSRALYYEFVHENKDPGRAFKGKTLRRFRMGHWHEEETAEWMRLGGFDLRTHDAQGEQYGWEDADGKIAGHLDGVLLAGTVILPYPLLWEHKIMKASKWKELCRKGIEAAFPVYFAQCQLYMAHMGLENCLFQAVNSDTSELKSILIKFWPEWAQSVSDKAYRVITATCPEDLPRITRDSHDFRCKWCDYKKTCWA